MSFPLVGKVHYFIIGSYMHFVQILFRYGLFASLSSVLKTNMAGHLPTITKLIVDSLKSTEGVVVSIPVATLQHIWSLTPCIVHECQKQEGSIVPLREISKPLRIFCKDTLTHSKYCNYVIPCVICLMVILY